MISCIIVDDEKKAREALSKIIDKYFSDKLEVKSMASSVKEAKDSIELFNPDLVFLDIEMPVENGFQLFSYFDNYEFEVIFTTAYENYAIDAIKFAALDYILKPVNYIDLNDALKRLEKKRVTESNQERIETLIDNFQTDSLVYSKIALPVIEGFVMVKIADIVFCQAEESYTMVYTIQGKKICASKTIGAFEEILPEAIFFRIHKSSLVNLNYVSSYSRTDGYKICMETGQELDVATRRNDAFLNAIHRKL